MMKNADIALLQNVYRVESICQLQKASQNGSLPPGFVCLHQINQETNV